jgi:ubiquinone/menaquinone biosynthesis C-methylase UbiE
MGFYQRRILPWLIHFAMRNRDLIPLRSRIGAEASGRVLEIGVGSGLNFAYYGKGVRSAIALDPSGELLHMARRQAGRSGRDVHFLEGSAEAIALADASVDSIVTTFTLCSIPNLPRALSEARRVLRPGGRLLFAEHGRSPDAGVARLQDRLTPWWKPVAGGCHLNRAIDQEIAAAGFALQRLETGYLPGPRPFTYVFQGSATRR